jgi:uncharacterized delta-60 repeat protein
VVVRSAALDTGFHSPVFADETWYPLRVAVMPDGSFVTFGNIFDRLGEARAAPLISFRADGSRNTAFHFAEDIAEVVAAAPTNEGKLIVAGIDERKQGRRWPFWRLNADGSVDSTFAAPTFDNAPRTITVQPDGKILVGGQFNKVNGVSRPFLARLNTDGTVDTSFSPISLASTGSEPFATATGIYAQIVVQNDGKILVAGAFDQINGVAVPAVARLNSNGSTDNSFVPSGFQLRVSTGVRRSTRAVALQADGHVIVSGRLTDPSSTQSLSTVRLNPNGSLASPVGIESGSLETRAVAVLPNQDIVVAEEKLYRFHPDGTLADGYPKHLFYFDASGTFTLGSDIAVQSTGKVLVAGPAYVDEVPRGGVARFLPNGELDAFTVGAIGGEGKIHHVATRSDGKIYVSGEYTSVDGSVRPGVVRLLPNGNLDSAFDPGALGYVFSAGSYAGFVLHPDGRVLVYGVSAANFDIMYQRFLPNGELDPDFRGTDADHPPALAFRDAQLEPDGSYLVLNPLDRTSIVQNTSVAHLLVDGQADTNFSLPFDFSSVATSHDSGGVLTAIYAGDNRAIAFLADGRMLLRYFDATGNYKLVRLNKNGALDDSFAQGAVAALSASTSQSFAYDSHAQRYVAVSAVAATGSPLSDAVVQADGKAIVVGMFTKYNGTPAPGIVRLLSNGAVDTSFRAGGGAQWTQTVSDATHVPEIDSVVQEPDGKLLIAGTFEAYDGVAAQGIARLNADGSIDPTFTPPAELKDGGPFLPFPPSRIYPDQNGKYFLTSRYAAPGEEWQHSLLRFNVSAPPLLNISTRARVLSGDNVLIGGFIITGSEPKTVLLRGIGPSLSVNGTPVVGRLQDPTLQLFSGGAMIAANDNWKETQQSEIANSGAPPANDFESAIVATLAPGKYTAVLGGKNSGTGIGLVEVYDLNQGANAKLANISTRGFVQTGDQVMIGGFIVGNESARFIVRALGPSLGTAGVANSLPDPTLQIVNSSGTVIDSNDNWKSDHQAEIEATTVAPTNDAESAVVDTLAPGNYTAVVSGKGSATGVGLIEVYNIP